MFFLCGLDTVVKKENELKGESQYKEVVGRGFLPGWIKNCEKK